MEANLLAFKGLWPPMYAESTKTTFVKTRHDCIFHISRNTTLKYSSYCGSLMPVCIDAA